MFSRRLLMLLPWLLSATAAHLSAQQVTISVPQHNVSGGYYEYIGGRWVYFGPGFELGLGAQSFPVYGGFDPHAGLQGGFAFGGGGTGGMLNFSAVSGGSANFTSTTPMLTVTNGIPGSITMGRFRPFVIGTVPVVGPAVNPAFVNLGAANSIAGRMQRGEFHVRNGQVLPGPDPGWQLPLDVPEEAHPVLPREENEQLDGAANELFRRKQSPAPAADAAQNDPNAEALDLWKKAQDLESAGKPGAAKLLYQTAARQATGELRDRIESRLRALD
jgi:hypothetical protein